MMTACLEIQTPELVPIRLRPAGWGSRFGAFLIDLFILVLFISGWISLCVRLLPGAIAPALAITGQFLLTWGYHAFFEQRWNGQSPGKRVYHLRVVDSRGLALTLPQSLLRNIVRLIDLLPMAGGLGALSMFLDPHRRRLGDLAAGTIVVDERALVGDRLQTNIERRHNSYDTPQVRRRIRHRLDAEHRAFLTLLCLRADKLSAEARYDCMHQAATYFRSLLELDADEGISDENCLRSLADIALRD